MCARFVLCLGISGGLWEPQTSCAENVDVVPIMYLCTVMNNVENAMFALEDFRNTVDIHMREKESTQEMELYFFGDLDEGAILCFQSMLL